MKRIFLALIVMMSFVICKAQPSGAPWKTNNDLPGWLYQSFGVKNAFYLPRNNSFQPTNAGALRSNTNTNNIERYDSTGASSGNWLPLVDSIFNGNRTITRDFSTLNGQNLGTQGLKQTLEALLYPSQNPTSGLTITYNAQTSSSLILEKASGTTASGTLNWSAGRLASTQPLQSIVVNGISQSFSQPSAPGTVTGTQAVTVTINTNQSFSNVVTTTDSKTATSSASITWRTKWYYGFVDQNITSPTDADIIAIPGQALVANYAAIVSSTAAGLNISNSTASRLVIAIDLAIDPSGSVQIWINGLNSTGVFTRTVRSFTNASGYATNYEIYVQSTVTSAGVSLQMK